MFTKAYPCTNHLLSTRKIPFETFSNKNFKVKQLTWFKKNNSVFMTLHKSGVYGTSLAGDIMVSPNPDITGFKFAGK